MTYRGKKDWKDLVEFCKHPHGGLTRRDFIARGMATGAMTVALEQMVAGQFLAQAHADAPTNCPAPVRNPGAIAQLFPEGGPTMGARFFSDNQAAMMNANMAKNYGISGQGNIQKLGPNMNIDKTSAFGFTLLQGPPGYPGGAAAWQT